MVFKENPDLIKDWYGDFFSPVAHEKVKLVKIQRNTSLVIQVKLASEVNVVVPPCENVGLVEVNGRVLVVGKSYKFYSCMRFSIDCYKNCQVILYGKNPDEHEYTEVKMSDQSIQLCTAFNQMRESATQLNKLGPTIMIVGSRGTGKSTLALKMLNSACRTESSVQFIDLNPDGCNTSPPGTIASVLVENKLDPALPFFDKNKQILHYGHMDITKDKDLYKKCVRDLMTRVRFMTETVPKLKHAGMVIDTPPVTSQESAEVIVRSVRCYSPQFVIVLGQTQQEADTLKAILSCRLSSTTQLSAWPCEPGISFETYDRAYRLEMCSLRLHHYFVGKDFDNNLKRLSIPIRNMKSVSECCSFDKSKKKLQSIAKWVRRRKLDKLAEGRILSVVDKASLLECQKQSAVNHFLYVEKVTNTAVTVITPLSNDTGFSKKDFLLMNFFTSLS